MAQSKGPCREHHQCGARYDYALAFAKPPALPSAQRGEGA